MTRIVPLALVVLATACAPSVPTPSKLDEQREIWEAQGISDYTFLLRYSCYCADETTTPVQVTVTGGEVVDAVYAEDADGILAGDPVGEEYGALSIDGLFDFLEEAYEEADLVGVEYDDSLGYPTAGWIDYIEEAVDDEVSVFVSAFTAD